MQSKRKFCDYLLCKIQLNARNRVYFRVCQVAMAAKMLLWVDELKGYWNISSKQVAVYRLLQTSEPFCDKIQWKWETEKLFPTP